MKIETPQILWHSDTGGSSSSSGGCGGSGGKLWAAPLSGLSLSPRRCSSHSNSSRSSSSISSRGSSHTTAPTATSSGTAAPVSSRSPEPSRSSERPVHHHCLATVGRGTDVHLWKIAFPVSTQASASAAAAVAVPVVDAAAATVAVTAAAAATTGTARSTVSSSSSSSIEFVCALSRHEGPINAVAFSPNGIHLATAGETGCIIVWSVPVAVAVAVATKHNDDTNDDGDDSDYWTDVVRKESDLAVAVIGMTPSNGVSAAAAVTDLSWSPDSRRLLVSTMEGAVILLEQQANPIVNASPATTATTNTTSTATKWEWHIVFRNTSLHTHYVQGVAFDPSNVYLASQSSDRTVRVWPRIVPPSVAAAAAASSLPRSSAMATTEPANALVASSPTVAAGSRTSMAPSTSSSAKKVLQPHNPTTTSTTTRTSLDGVAVSTCPEQGPTTQQLTESKFEVSNKTKLVKYRQIQSNTTTGTSSTSNSNDAGDELITATAASPTVTTTATTTTTTTTTTATRVHWYEGETMLKSFVRRLAWTVDGAYLITPAAIWTPPTSTTDAAQSPTSDSSKNGKYATLLHQRHRFDEPWKVLGGLDKPSIAVCPNPVLFQLPRSADDHSKENTGSVTTTTAARGLPYRTIFAVLTWDSVLVYDTIHDQPLAVAQGLHFAHLVDAVWTPDGRNLLVCSTDGYISIIRFEAGELGNEYISPVAVVSSTDIEARSMKQTIQPHLPCPLAPCSLSNRLPPCEPGPATVHCPPAKRTKTRITPTPLLMETATVSVGETAGTSTGSSATATSPDALTHKRTASEAAMGVDKLSLTDTAATTIHVLQPMKKPKKRIQPTLMSVS